MHVVLQQHVSCACRSTNVENWPNDRGSAVGAMKAAVGLSGCVYGVVYGALSLDTSHYLLLMMLGPALGCVLALPLVNIVPWIQKSELQPKGRLTTPKRFLLSYQVRSVNVVWRIPEQCHVAARLPVP